MKPTLSKKQRFFNQINLTRDDDLYIGIDVHKANYHIALYLNGDHTGTTKEDVIYFLLTEDDKKQFPELEDDNYLWLYQSEQGFINSGTSHEEPT